MQRGGLGLFGFLLGVFLFGGPAEACSCGSVGTLTPQQSLERSLEKGSPVLLAEVVYQEHFLETSETTNPDGEAVTRETDMVRLLLIIHEAWNWDRKSAWAVTRAGGGPSCGVNYRPYERYLVRAGRNERGEFELGLCSRSLLNPASVDLNRAKQPDTQARWPVARRQAFEESIRKTYSRLRPGCQGVFAERLRATIDGSPHKPNNDLIVTLRTKPKPDAVSPPPLSLNLRFMQPRRKGQLPYVRIGHATAHPRCWLRYQATPVRLASRQVDPKLSASVPPGLNRPYTSWNRDERLQIGMDFEVTVERQPTGSFFRPREPPP